MSNSVRKEREGQDRLVEVLGALLREEDNKYCVDCDCKGPRWASWTLGIFLCIRCAGIHRNLGVHISRVKSVNLDSWTPQQVAMMKEIGNSRGRAIYEANLDENFRRPQTDSTLEQFIRAKYEHKRYIAKEWIPPCPSADIIADEIRKLEQNSLQKKRATNTYSGNNIIVKREVQSVPTVPRKLNQETEKSKTEQNNKVDLLGLDNIISDDTFGDFVFALQTTASSVVNPPVIVSSAVDDLMGLSLGNNVVSINTSFNNTVNESSFSTQLSSLTAVNSPLDKNSILALYNNNNVITSATQASGQAWPGIGVPNYQMSVAPQADIYSMQQQQSQQYYGGSNWINAQPLQSQQGSFGMQHNPFFSNNTFQTQNQSTFTSAVNGQPPQQSNSVIW